MKYVLPVFLLLCLFFAALWGGQGNVEKRANPSETGKERVSFVPSELHDEPILTSESVLGAVGSIPQVSGFILFQHGEIIDEQYWRNHGRGQTRNIKSASKNILSTLVGIAIEQGHISSIDDPISNYLSDSMNGVEPEAKQNITIKHLLTMSSGLESTSFGNYGRWVVSRNWVQFVLNGNLVNEPGSQMHYSTGDTHLLSAVLTSATGMSTRRYAEEVLFGPLNVRVGGWDRDPQGIYFGGNNLALSPGALLAYGRLYLDGGVYNGEQVVPRSWVEESFRTEFENTSFNPRGHSYGYLWWNNTFGGQEAWFAWGYGGQYVFVMPALDAVVVLTGNPDARGRGANNVIYRLMDEAIVPYLVANRR